ncbi:G-type lectin S-receptor-like serine/threonine-protein kinase At1g11410 [Neltuma alba]|uniref:G-type lectin S-receptor-like serine/threonine-protein kinase At1g11410 n=1 Tax=Neltuma alba TaxID=207710 RepID=UPI0010A2F67C|nr:G-type lectin S-receptor-like serine/threonine-protein kinase At1g11410 [Prosopis alba]
MKLLLAKELTLINIPHFLILFLFSSSCHSLNRITPGKPLKNGDVLVSDGTTFALGFFTPDENSKNSFVGIWYNQVSERTLVWVANRGNPLNDTSGILSIDIHGNIVLVANHTNPNPIWSSNVSLSSSSSPTKTFAKLLDTGNLVLVENNGTSKVLWQSFDYPCDTMLPLMKLGLDKKTGLKRFLTSWKSLDDPRPGSMSYKIDPRGYPQFFVYKNEDPIYRAGSWTGQRWGGIPEMIPNYFIFNVSFVDDANETSIMYSLNDPSALSRMVLDNSGHLSRYTWQPEGHRWQEILHIPRDNCDHYRRCGSNSYCDSYYVVADKFQCVCLPGFESENPEMRKGSGGGCVRKKDVSTCQSGEGFVKVPRAKLPDTSKVELDDKSIGMSSEECKEKCAKDCSCEAFASANEVTLRGCLTWHADMEDIRIFNSVGQDLYVRVDAVELAKYENKPHSSLGKKGMGALVVSVCLLMLVITFVYWFAKKKKQARRRLDGYLVDRGNGSDLSLFDLSDIIAATENFSDANKLGHGGFGSVYKGILQNGMTVAVKRLSQHSGRGTKEFKNEATLMAKLQHRNLVKILGYCIQGKERILIYEYLPNKSLDIFIFEESYTFTMIQD